MTQRCLFGKLCTLTSRQYKSSDSAHLMGASCISRICCEPIPHVSTSFLPKAAWTHHKWANSKGGGRWALRKMLQTLDADSKSRRVEDASQHGVLWEHESWPPQICKLCYLQQYPCKCIKMNVFILKDKAQQRFNVKSYEYNASTSRGTL